MEASRSWWRVAAVMFVVGWGANQFTPLELVYSQQLNLTQATLSVLFGVYALALVPALFAAARISDRRGRRWPMLVAAALSPLGTAVLAAGADVPALVVGRLIAGACSGVASSVGTAWIRDLSAHGPQAARRAAVALSAGFGAGPLVAALLAQWAPEPLRVPYLPQVVLGVAAAALLAGTPEPVRDRPPAAVPLVPAAARDMAFWSVLVPLAPWVFATASVAFAVLPEMVASTSVLFAGVTTALTLVTGMAVQPAARRLDDWARLSAGATGLAATLVGLGVGALAVMSRQPALIVIAAIPFGAGYGLCLVAGLREAETYSAADDRASVNAVLYTLAYAGFAAPYLLTLLEAGLGKVGALAVTAAVAVACLWQLSVKTVRFARSAGCSAPPSTLSASETTPTEGPSRP